jgi:hypothetical protein
LVGGDAVEVAHRSYFTQLQCRLTNKTEEFSSYNPEKYVGKRMSRTRALIIVVVALNLLMPVIRELRFAGLINLNMQLAVAYAAFALSIAVGIMGLWTPSRRAWFAYLAATLACIVFFGSLPLSTASIFARLAIRHIV